jgi:hypothetical protein
MDVMSWLLDADPALRWQVERDLLKAPPEVWQATRARVATEGFGARLLELQDSDGQWAGGAYFPAGYKFGEQEQPWTATTWVLNMLREFGVNASRLGDTADRLRANARWEYDDLPYWDGEVDCCINSWTLMNGLWLGQDMSGLVTWFAEHQLADGGWNCEWVEGAAKSSYHSTLNSLKGLLAADGTQQVRKAGEEYLLQRSLHKRLSTGEPVAGWATRFAYPFRWHYSVLNAADYFRAASVKDGTAPDQRMAEAIELIRSAQEPDGTWLQQWRHPGQVWFEVDAAQGEPSKWLTFYATRVLDWWSLR